jgi:hypothetical protein
LFRGFAGGGFGFHVNLSFHAEGDAFGATFGGLARLARPDNSQLSPDNRYYLYI